MTQLLPVVTNCDDCGACCTGQAALPIHLRSAAIFRMESVSPLPPELDAELDAAVERFAREGFPPDDSACIWYDVETKRCKHYDYRPDLCRDAVEPGDESCLVWRRQLNVTGVTPSLV